MAHELDSQRRGSIAMELSPLFRECHIKGPNGLWANYNNDPRFTCSLDGYLMGLTPPHFSRLDDMSGREEKDFWDFTFTLAAQGIANPEKRGVPESRPIRESMKPCHVIVAVNDGPVTWQTIGSNHSHIVWAAEENPVFPMDICYAMGKERAAAHGSGKYYDPVASTQIFLTPDHYAEDIRRARKTLKNVFLSEANTGFSLYTRYAQPRDPRNGALMVIEAWTDSHDSKISVSNALRVLGHVRPSHDDTLKRGLKYCCFINQI